ncbi:MAG: ABC transporter substrate-binding protein [Bacteroidota bacterium]|nr:ABC transporter substrate-binding protein [Bacteroidota bacterium]
MNRIVPLIFTAALILGSCRNAGNRQVHSASADSNAATRLSIEKEEGFTRVTVTEPWQNSEGTKHVWYLLPHEAELPAGVSEAQAIRVPVRKIICMSTTHVAMMRALGVENLIAGLSGSSLIYDSLVLRSISSGRIVDVGYEGNLNRELIISLGPDLVMAYGVAGPSAGGTARLTGAGVKVFYNADYLEENPLARCEWIKLFGLLTGREEKADSIYNSVADAYRSLSDRVAASVTSRPGVLLGAPWEDVWYVSPSNSYIGKLIADAGGDYIYRDMTGPNSIPLSVESVFRRAAEAEIWINPGTAETLSEITAADPRMASLPLFSKGNIWNNRRRITVTGGNDYWESAVVRPDLLLCDLVSILHPELMPGYVQTYYMKLK